MSTSNINNNISDISSSQESIQLLTEAPTGTPAPTETPPPTGTPAPTLPPIINEGVLTSNINTKSYFGSMILYFSPEYESCYSTKFTATLSDTNYIKFNGNNSNVDVYKSNSNKVSFNILSKTDPAYIGLNFCSYKNTQISDNDSAYKIGKVTIESNKWFNYRYSNTSDKVDNTEINLYTETLNESSYKSAPKINISYTYQTFTNTVNYFDSVKENIQINLESQSNKPENSNVEMQNITIMPHLDLPFGLGNDLFKDNGECFFSIKTNIDENVDDKYEILKRYFKYVDDKLPDSYGEFINTSIKKLYLYNEPSESISITLIPYVRYQYYNNSPIAISSSYNITINIPGAGQSKPSTEPSGSPIP